MPNKHPNHDRAIAVCQTYLTLRPMVLNKLILEEFF